MSLFHSLLSVGGGFDADYQAILDRATTLGYTQPSASQKILQNQLVLDLKSNSIWTLIDVFYVFANDGSQEFATLNWKAPSLYQLSIVNSITWTSNIGFNANVSTMHLNYTTFPFITVGNFSQDEAGFFMGLTNLVSNVGSYACGGGTNIDYQPQYAADGRRKVRLNNTTQGTPVRAINANSFRHINRVNSTTVREWQNGISPIDVALTSVAIETGRDLVLCNRSAKNSNLIGEMSCFGLGASLTGSELGLYTGWNTYITSL